MQKIRFVDSRKSQFYATVRNRVDDYFAQNNLSKHGNAAMWAKIAFFLGGTVLCYGLILSGWFSPWGMLGLAIVLGMFAAFVGFNVSHDSIHGALSPDPRVNKLVSLSFNLLGANAYMWNITHNIVHHTYTNIHGHDEDLEVAPGLIRLDDKDELSGFQRYQHYYAFPLYGLASLSWVLRKDYVKFFQKRIGSYDTASHPRREYFNLFFFKALYYTLFIVVPLVVLDITWWQFLIGFVAMHLAEGLVLGLVFQLAHVVEGPGFPEPDTHGNIEEAWAAHQMHTTANFASGKPLATFLCGGLNMQVEHHLFPKICHIHYPAISNIVRQTAAEFNLPYYEQKTFLSALRSHYRVLRKYGKEAHQQLNRKDATLSAA